LQPCTATDEAENSLRNSFHHDLATELYKLIDEHRENKFELYNKMSGSATTVTKEWSTPVQTTVTGQAPAPVFQNNNYSIGILFCRANVLQQQNYTQHAQMST
jgi:hypothetical protein